MLQSDFGELDLFTVLAVVLLGQEDSTGQRITFIVIGLLLAALVLAILTAWYYRVTDPGPHKGRRPSSAGGSQGDGLQVGRGPEPSPGPGWRKRLKGFSIPTGQDQSPRPASSKAQKSTQPTPETERVSPKAQEASETVSLKGGHYLDLTDSLKSPDPKTNVGSVNSLDLRQPAPLLDPDEQASVPVPTVPEPQAVQETTPTADLTPSPPPTKGDTGLSFDEWLAAVEGTAD